MTYILFSLLSLVVWLTEVASFSQALQPETLSTQMLQYPGAGLSGKRKEDRLNRSTLATAHATTFTVVMHGNSTLLSQSSATAGLTMEDSAQGSNRTTNASEATLVHFKQAGNTLAPNGSAFNSSQWSGGIVGNISLTSCILPTA